MTRRTVCNTSYDHRDWSTAKLIREINGYANMTNFGASSKLREGETETAFIRRATQSYRNSWLNPLIDELRLRTEKDARWFKVPMRDIGGGEYIAQIEVVATGEGEAQQIAQARYQNFELVK